MILRNLCYVRLLWRPATIIECRSSKMGCPSVRSCVSRRQEHEEHEEQEAAKYLDFAELS